MLGLSATPNINHEKHRIVYARSFAELCPQFLAEPQVREVKTGTTWNPIVQGGAITPRSLSELGRREDRNGTIVEEHLDGHGAGRYTRSLIFACDIAHANELNRRLSQRGVACRAVHSGHPRECNHRTIAAFRQGRLDALVTVGMLTEVLDVPEIDAIFLARPTDSLTLLAQMTGRGARKRPGKESFSLVEFTDNVDRLGSQLFHARDYVTPPPRNRGRRSSGAARHHAEPEGVPQFEHLRLPGLEGVTFVRDQTFGVEIELSSRRHPPGTRGAAWHGTAETVIERLHAAARLPVHRGPLDYHELEDATRWRVCYDGSCGWEVVSPILVNGEGIAELARVCGALTRLTRESDLCINRQTGLHITLATRLNSPERRRGFAARLTRLEPGLYTLVAPSRLYECWGPGDYDRRGRNRYSQPVREMRPWLEGAPFGRIADGAGRHSSVNLTKADGALRLLEVRMHHGTTEARKIIPWIALWMHIFNHSRYC